MTKSVSEVGAKSHNNKSFMVTDFFNNMFCFIALGAFIVWHYKCYKDYENDILHYFCMKIRGILHFGNLA